MCSLFGGCVPKGKPEWTLHQTQSWNSLKRRRIGCYCQVNGFLFFDLIQPALYFPLYPRIISPQTMSIHIVLATWLHSRSLSTSCSLKGKHGPPHTSPTGSLPVCCWCPMIIFSRAESCQSWSTAATSVITTVFCQHCAFLSVRSRR